MTANDHLIDLVDGKFKKTTAADLDKLFGKIANDPDGDHLVLHFHGGLVGRKSATNTAVKLLSDYRGGGAFPVFFVWNSDILSTLRYNLDEIVKDKAFKRIVKQLARFLAGKLGEGSNHRGRIKVPTNRRVPEDPKKLEDYLTQKEATSTGFRTKSISKAQERQLSALLSKDTGLKLATRQIAADLREDDAVAADAKRVQNSRGRGSVRGSSKTVVSPAILREIREQSTTDSARSLQTARVFVKYGIRIARAVMKRYKNKRDHGLYATIVEETVRALYLDNAGIVVWNMMKKDTLDAFGGDPAVHGGTAILEQLKSNWPKKRRVTLVGHSTGAIFIANFLEHADKVLPAHAKFDVVFLAPATTFDDMYRDLPVFKNRVNAIRVFGLSDELESGYWEVPVLYNRSLLYLVSGVLEEAGADTPIIGMERYYSGKKPYDQKSIKAVANYLKGERLWAITAPAPGRHTKAKKHGGFDREKYTLESTVHILRNGM